MGRSEITHLCKAICALQGQLGNMPLESDSDIFDRSRKPPGPP